MGCERVTVGPPPLAKIQADADQNSKFFAPAVPIGAEGRLFYYSNPPWKTLSPPKIVRIEFLSR